MENLKLIVILNTLMIVLTIVFVLMFIMVAFYFFYIVIKSQIGKTVRIEYKGRKFKCKIHPDMNWISVYHEGILLKKVYFFSVNLQKKDAREYCVEAINDAIDTHEKWIESNIKMDNAVKLWYGIK